ncbi:eEF1-gamma domain-containing protein [Lizonia empirigonia]|nr:eEF1-gamma domain-containing protein [Lizonia empirigonia]
MSFGKIYSYSVKWLLRAVVPAPAEKHKLTSPPTGNPRTTSLLAVAKENGLDIEFVDTEPAKGVSTDYLKINKLGKVLPSRVLTASFSLRPLPSPSTVIASQNEKTMPPWQDQADYATILRWMSFANTEVLTPSVAGIHVLEEHLLTHTYLVGERLTLADLFAASIVARGFQYFFDKKWSYSAVAGKLEFIEEAIKNHPLEALPAPPSFLTDWKRKYSNEETREVALPGSGRTSTSRSTLSGPLTTSFPQVYLGCASVYGEANNSIIKGAFLVRGQEALPAFDVAPDFESYEFTKLDPTKDEDKKFVEDQWSWDKPLVVDGKTYEWADGKVFK